VAPVSWIKHFALAIVTKRDIGRHDGRQTQSSFLALHYLEHRELACRSAPFDFYIIDSREWWFLDVDSCDKFCNFLFFALDDYLHAGVAHVADEANQAMAIRETVYERSKADTLDYASGRYLSTRHQATISRLLFYPEMLALIVYHLLNL
jgi:hypothetical protein